MSNYSPLCSVYVNHSYYTDNNCTDITLLPTLNTRQLLRNVDLFIKTNANGLDIFYETGKLDALKMFANSGGDESCLDFVMVSKVSRFFEVSDPQPYKKNKIMYFDNRNAKRISAFEYKMHTSEFISASDFMPSSRSLALRYAYEEKLLSQPIAYISIDFSQSKPQIVPKKSEPKHIKYYLQFDTKKTYWKYYFLGDLNINNVQVLDVNNEIKFVEVGEEQIDNNKLAKTFISKNKVALHQDMKHQFQLKRNNSNSGVIIKSLPMATTSQLGKQKMNGKEVLVSEIYVNF